MAKNRSKLSIFHRPFHHHTNSFNTWSLNIVFIIITTSSGQIKNISWSQEHLACNFEKQAQNLRDKTLNFWLTLATSHQCLKYMDLTYFIHHDITFIWPNQEHLIKSGIYWMYLAKTSNTHGWTLAKLSVIDSPFHHHTNASIQSVYLFISS